MARALETKDMAVIAISSVAMSAAVNRFCALAEMYDGDFFDGIGYAAGMFLDITKYPTVFSGSSLALTFTLAAAVLTAYVFINQLTKGTFRRGEEHGSSRWATKKEIERLADTEVDINNTILSKNVRLKNQGHMDFLYKRNRNIAVVGGSGSGKSWSYYMVNLMQIPAEENAGAGKHKTDLQEQEKYARSFFMTDPKGTICGDMGHMFAEHGYVVKEFNTIDFERSLHYNPLKYIRSDEDVESFITCLMKNTTGDKEHKGDPFWENSESQMYTALIHYMITEVAEEDRNLVTMCEMLDLGDVDDTTGQMSGLDILFTEVETGKHYNPDVAPPDMETGQSVKAATYQTPSPWEDTDKPPRPDHLGVKAYNSFKTGAADTKRSILISCKVRLQKLRTKRVSEILRYDEMELDLMGDRKTVLFGVVSATDPTYNFLFAMLIWQMINELTRRATLKYNGSLPVPVDFLLDEMANYYIPGMEQTIAVTRSYNIGISMGLQSTSQLDGKYGEAQATTILNNCDSVLFFGGRDAKTNEKFEKEIGQQTVTTDNTSKSHAQQNSWSEQLAQHARALMQSSELAKMPRDECIVMVSNSEPYKDKKYSAADHPMFKWTSPGDGRMFTRKFDYAAYKENERYYAEGDAELDYQLEWLVYTTEPIGTHPALRSAYTVVQRLRLKNNSGAHAYHVRGSIQSHCKCLSNVGKTSFPGLDRRTTIDAVEFMRGDDARSSRMTHDSAGNVDDVFSYNRAMNAYEIENITLGPSGDEDGDDEILYMVSQRVDGEDMRGAIATHKDARAALEEGRGEEIAARFEFTYEADIDCANADSIRLKRTSILTIDAYGKATLEEAPAA